jgi:hypothetical protein
MNPPARLVTWLSLSVCFVLIAGSARASPRQEEVETSPERYLEHVRILASPDMQGRGNGTPELDRAAEYLAGQFEAMGLEPAGEGGTWFQTFEVTTDTRVGPGNALTLGDTPLEDSAFEPLRFSASGTVSSPLVFVGYGITAPEMHWDDYRDVEVTDKIVVAFRHEPQENVPESPFDGTAFTTHASLRNKAVNARQHGARGILFILDPNAHGPDEEEIEATARETETGDSGIAAAYVRMAPVLAAFREAGFDLAEIQQEIDTRLESRSFEAPGLTARLGTDILRVRGEVRNVLGAVRGSDPDLAREWIALGAHYDHLGLDGEFSLDANGEGQIHHGADDNASGTAGILELARLASARRDSLERSLLFMGFAGEEIGLLGSSHFVNNPTVEADSLVAMVNLDMIGRIQNDRVFVSGIGTSPGFQPLMTELGASSGLSLDFSESGMGASDHMPFNLKQIPVLFFFSGLHGDYHRPTDTADKINVEGAVRVLSLVWRTLDRLAEAPDRPLYTPVASPGPITGSGGGYGPYFGSIPDFRDDLGGVLFAGISEGSPAAEAGLRAGDLLVEFAAKPVGNLYDFTYALQAQKPGDVVVVVVVRAEERISAEVTLGAR